MNVIFRRQKFQNNLFLQELLQRKTDKLLGTNKKLRAFPQTQFVIDLQKTTYCCNGFFNYYLLEKLKTTSYMIR